MASRRTCGAQASRLIGIRLSRVGRLLGAVALVAVLLSLSVAANAAAPDPMIVTVDTSSAGTPVPARFVGLSFDVSSTPRLAGYATRGNLVNLMRSLGPGVLRLSGNSVDVDTAWVDPGEATPSWADSTISAADFQGIATLAQATGWKIVLGIGLGHFDPNSAAREAESAVNILGSHLEAIEIGNEPSEFPDVGLRPAANWSYAQYLTQFTAYRTAIAAAAPGLPIEGPDVTASLDSLNWISQFASDVHPQQLTAHYYPLAACGSAPTVGNLLGPQTDSKTSNRIGMLSDISQAAGIGLRISEANSVSCGGTPGTSDAFASSLWTLNFLMQAMKGGLAGINFQTIPSACDSYTPLCTVTDTDAQDGVVTVRPQYYALLLAGKLAGATMLPTSTAGATDGVNPSAFQMPDGDLAYLVVNTTGSRVPVRLLTGMAHAVASLLELRASSPYALTGVTLGGATVSPDGTWAPADSGSVSAGADGSVAVTVAADSAMLVVAKRSAAQPAGSGPEAAQVSPAGAAGVFTTDGPGFTPAAGTVDQPSTSTRVKPVNRPVRTHAAARKCRRVAHGRKRVGRACPARRKPSVARRTDHAERG